MAWTWIPDNPMMNYPSIQPTNNGPSLQDIMIGQTFLEELKKKLEEETKKKKDDEKKKKPSELPKLSLLETWALVMTFGPVALFLQKYLVQSLELYLNAPK